MTSRNSDIESGNPQPNVPVCPYLHRVTDDFRFASVAMVLLALVCFLPGFLSVPPLDRDESRFAQASKQMMESGDYIDIRFQEEPRHKKPIGIYWLQVASAKITGFDSASPIWIYRLPSLLGAILAVFATFWCAMAFRGPQEAFLAAILVSSTILLGVEARIAKTDAALLACIVFAQGALARIWLNRDKLQKIGLVLIFWTAISASVLIKGPVGPMVVALTALAICIVQNRWSWLLRLKPLLGLAICTVIILPWFVAITTLTNGEFFYESVVNDLLSKVGEGQESHGAPPLTHLVAMLATFWPIPAFFAMAVPSILRSWREPAMLFMIAWIVPTWLVFELVSTKLPHYTMPILPAVAMATVIALTTWKQDWRLGRWLGSFLLVFAPLGLLAIAVVVPIELMGSISIPSVFFLLSGAFVSVFAARQIIKKSNPLTALGAAIVAAVFLYAGIWGLTLPSMSTIWISPRLAGKIEEVSNCDNPSIRIWGYNEPSIVFLTRTDTKFQSVEQIGAWLAEPGCKIAVVEVNRLKLIKELAKKQNLNLESRAVVNGLNYNGGDRLSLHLLQTESDS